MSIGRYLFSLIAFAGCLSLQAQSYSIQCEDTCSHIHGIDLSHYQGGVFWEAIGDNSRMAYVYLKATEGGDNIDSKYEENIRLAKAYGVKVGSYHFFRPKKALAEQLRNFRSQCRPDEQELIPMIDVETTGGLNNEDFCDSLLTFLQLVAHEYRVRPLVYTGMSFYNKHLQGKLDNYRLMIARYSSDEPKLDDGRDIFAWQYTAKGRINGVNGYIDKSRLMGRHTLREISYRMRR